MLFGLSKKFQGSISLRISFLFCVTFSLSLFAAFVISFFQIKYTLEKSALEVISSKLHEAAAILISGDTRGLKDFLSDEKNRILNAPYLVRVLTQQGETLYLKPSIQEKNFDFVGAFKKIENPDKLLGWSSLDAIDDEDEFDILTEKISDKFYLQVGKSNEDHEDVLGNLLQVFMTTGGFFILLSAVVGTLYARRALNPVRRLLSTIKEIETGNLSKRVEVGGSENELRDLSETFNRMISRIELLIQVMKDSLDNVAHEIRTPLTRIKAISEDALTSNNPTPLKEALESCAEGAAEVSELVDQLMSIAEAEAGTLTLQLEVCNIETILKDVADIYEFVAQEKEVTITVTCISGVIWSLDRKRIKQAIGNLLDNAIKFSAKNSLIDISALIQNNQLQIAVKDNGVGISEADLTKIWDRLFRGDKSRTTKGLGLGLSIVRSVAMAHHGKTEANKNPEGGMTFNILIPNLGIHEHVIQL